MRTSIVSITLSCLGLLALVGCAAREDLAPTTDEADGIRATSRAGDGCGGDTCIITTLNDVATGTLLATVTWNADTATGTIVEPARTTQITTGLPAMTAAEANETSRIVWSQLEGRTEVSTESVAGGVSNSTPATCTSTTNPGRTCTCETIVCMSCVPVEHGESCLVTVTVICWGTWPAYMARCGGMQA